METVDFDENTDNRAAITSAAGAGRNAVVARSLKKGTWNSIVVPHAMNVQAIIRNFGDGALVARQTGETGNGIIHFTTVSEIEAGIPYLVKPTIDVVSVITLNTNVSSNQVVDEGTSYDFVGVYAPTTISENDYFVADGNKLQRNTNPEGKLKAFRAYFKSKDNEAKPLVGFDVDGETTGIKNVAPAINDGVGNDDNIYTLSGQRVKEAKRGIYIVGGRKMVVR